MIRDVTYQEATRNAAHYLAIGQREIYVDLSEFPWQYAVSCEPGGSHRLDIRTDVWLRANDPSGLQFRASFDIEPHSANGSSGYHIDRKGCMEMMKRLPLVVREAFRAYLLDCAKAVEKHGAEWAEAAAKELADAQVLRELAAAPSQP